MPRGAPLWRRTGVTSPAAATVVLPQCPTRLRTDGRHQAVPGPAAATAAVARRRDDCATAKAVCGGTPGTPRRIRGAASGSSSGTVMPAAAAAAAAEAAAAPAAAAAAAAAAAGCGTVGIFHVGLRRCVSLAGAGTAAPPRRPPAARLDHGCASAGWQVSEGCSGWHVCRACKWRGSRL